MNRLIPAVGLLIVALWFLWLAQVPILQAVHVGWNAQTMGAWGETFGAFNALFAALGFGAVLLTLRLQQKQLAAAQNREHREQFDSAFFELLRLFREARLDVNFRHTMDYTRAIPNTSRERHTGLEAFQYAWYEAQHWIADETTTAETAAKAYERMIHRRYESALGPYFRLLYTMLQRVRDDPVLPAIEKVRYANLLRSQLTSYEIAIAALNGLCTFSQDFGALVVEFRLLKYLTGGRRRILVRYYPRSAFEGRKAADSKPAFRPRRPRVAPTPDRRIAAALQEPLDHPPEVDEELMPGEAEHRPAPKERGAVSPPVPSLDTQTQ